MKQRIRVALEIVLLVVLLYGLFFFWMVIPNDRRATPPYSEVPLLRSKLELAVDLTRSLSSAVVRLPATDTAEELLAKYPSKTIFPRTASRPLLLRLSLGWLPLKAVERECIFAPAPTDIEYSLQLPDKPVLKFDYGIISTIDGKRCSPVSFTVTLVDQAGEQNYVFQRTVEPLPPYRWHPGNVVYRYLVQYLHPSLEERDGRWESANIDLNAFAGQKVKLRFTTQNASAGAQSRALGFWAGPRLYAAGRTTTKQNILLIVIGSLRGDALSEQNAPTIFGLSQVGVNCLQAYAGSSDTKDSLQSLLSSRYPLELDRSKVTLPSLLNERGYRTAAIGSAAELGCGNAAGFDEIELLEHRGYSPVHVASAAIEWLKLHGSEPFYLQLNFAGPSASLPPIRYLWRAFDGKGKPGGMRGGLYRAGILYHDAYVKKLLRFLASSALREDTIIVVTSDHGVSLTDFAPGNKPLPELLHVPLIVFCNTLDARAVPGKVQLLDLAPTLLSLAGIPVPDGFRGHDLRQQLQGKACAEELTFHQGGGWYGLLWKNDCLYIRGEGETNVPEELYNIRPDPCCRVNRAQAEPEALERMRSAMDNFLTSNHMQRSSK